MGLSVSVDSIALAKVLALADLLTFKNLLALGGLVPFPAADLVALPAAGLIPLSAAIAGRALETLHAIIKQAPKCRRG